MVDIGNVSAADVLAEMTGRNRDEFVSDQEIPDFEDQEVTVCE
jgi:hypothetical protein